MTGCVAKIFATRSFNENPMGPLQTGGLKRLASLKQTLQQKTVATIAPTLHTMRFGDRSTGPMRIRSGLAAKDFGVRAPSLC